MTDLTELHRHAESVVLEQMFESELRCSMKHIFRNAELTYEEPDGTVCSVEAEWLITDSRFPDLLGKVACRVWHDFNVENGKVGFWGIRFRPI